MQYKSASPMILDHGTTKLKLAKKSVFTGHPVPIVLGTIEPRNSSFLTKKILTSFVESKKFSQQLRTRS